MAGEIKANIVTKGNGNVSLSLTPEEIAEIDDLPVSNKPPLTEKEKEKIAYAESRGVGVVAISKYLNRPKSTVSTYLQRLRGGQCEN